MSLISDALKKARQEAARQDAAQRGLPYAVGGGDSARRNGLAGPLVAGLAAGAVLAGAAALAAYFGHWGPWRASGAENLAQAPPVAVAASAPAAVPPAPEVQVPASAVPVVPAMTAAPVPQDPALRPRPASPSVQVAPPTKSPALRPEARPAPAAAAPSQSLAVTPAPPPARATPPSAPLTQAPRSAPRSDAPSPAQEGEERVYSGEVPVPGGGTLRLSGIAFSDNPVAVIDGKIVGRGEVIQGFTVVEIQRGRVRLQGHGQNVVVSVR